MGIEPACQIRCQARVVATCLEVALDDVDDGLRESHGHEPTQSGCRVWLIQIKCEAIRDERERCRNGELTPCMGFQNLRPTSRKRVTRPAIRSSCRVGGGPPSRLRRYGGHPSPALMSEGWWTRRVRVGTD